MKLIEQLFVIAIISILACILLVSVSKAFRASKAWIWGSQALSNGRIEAALDGNDKMLEFYCSQKVKKWTFINE
jgi:competence protein ComGC